MKNTSLLYLLLLLGVAAIFSSCDKEEEKIWGDPTFGFTVVNSEKLMAPAEIQFINNSKNGESYSWSFPKGKIMRGEVITSDSTTTDIQPERVFYPLPGEYQATLIVNANGEQKEIKQNFTVRKPHPIIEFSPAGIVYDDTVTFSAVYFQYPGMEDKVTFKWDFGNGEVSTLPNPITTFNPPGLYTVTLEIFDGVETLTATREVPVQAEIAKTLFFTNAINKSLFKKVLYTGTDLPHQDLGVDVGLHALSVNVFQDRLIVTVAGNNIKYAAEGTPADGYIFTTNLAGGNRWLITKAGANQDYRDDPFVGTVGPDGTIYFVNRFRGASRIHYTQQDAEFPLPYVFHEAAEGSDLAKAIGVASAYGWTDGAVRIVNGELWYSKHGTGKGLYRFTTEGAYIDKILPLFDLKIRTFEVDTLNDKIYFAINQAGGGFDPGIYVSNIDGTNITLIDPMTDFSMQGGEAERTFVTEMVIDAEGGYLYYPFRHALDITEAGVIVGDGSNSGIKRWKIDGSAEPEFYVTGVIPYGMGIDHVKR